MLQASVLNLGQQEILTDCVYDFYGLRLAASGLDAQIRLLRLNEQTGEWIPEEQFKAHDAPISKLSWAHPEHGPIIASSSFDRTVKVWEEDPVRGGNGNGSRVAGAGGQTKKSKSRWVERATLVEAKGSVRSVEFAPPHAGLKIATLSTDGYLRIYECLEIYKAGSWNLVEELEVLLFGGTSSSPASSVQAVTSTPRNEEASSPALSATSARAQTGSPSLPSIIRPGGGSREAEGGWCMTWCKDKSWGGDYIAVGCATSANLKIIRFSTAQRPALIATLPHVVPGHVPKPTVAGGSTSQFAITSVAWAPSCGRSYHLVATASRDTYVRIWKLKPVAATSGSGSGSSSSGAEEGKWEVKLVGEFDDHKAPVGRVEWNVTGTVLSSAGDDGQVRFFKALANVWRPLGSFNTHHVPDESEKEDETMSMS